MSSTTKAETANLIAQGYTNKQIGTTLGRSEKTIKSHATLLFKEYGVTNRTQFSRVYLERKNEEASQKTV